MSPRLRFILLFLGLLTFRTLFGLSQPFFSPDEVQTYLIGLKSYSTGAWPWFGPDLIVTETGFYSQLPGALEGLLIGLPFRVLPIPEAPFFLLNFLSLLALAFFGHYLCKRMPKLSFPLVFTWISLLPWNLHESTNIINPSYLLLGSILFFIGFLEALPATSLGWLSPARSFALMGFGLFWNMQFHSSWVLFPPLLLLALVARWKAKALAPLPSLGGFLAGSTFPLAFLLPTLLQFGFNSNTAGLRLFAAFNPSNFLSIYLIVPRFFSLACFEVQRFLLFPGLEHHMDFFRLHPSLILPGFLLILAGWLQCLSLILGPLKISSMDDRGKGLMRWTWITLGILWISFWLTSKEPLAHIYYILLPLVVAYSLHLWSAWSFKLRWAWVLVALNLWFQTGVLLHGLKTQSLYTDREKLVKAIESKDYHLVGERRPGSHN